MNTLTENLETLKRESIYNLPDKLNELDLFKLQFEEQLAKSVIQKGLW